MNARICDNATAVKATRLRGELHCRRYGRWYTWEAAHRGGRLLGDEWRLPTDDDWRQLSRHFGGVHDDSEDRASAAYHALLIEGRSGFNALLVADAPFLMASTLERKPTASTGRHRKAILPMGGSTTSPGAGWRSIASPMARSRGRSRCTASGSDLTLPAEPPSDLIRVVR